MEKEGDKQKISNENVKLKYVLQRTLLILITVVVLLIVFILVFLFIRNFVMVPNQLMAVSFAIDEGSVSLNDLTGELNFVARKIDGEGNLTNLVFVFIDTNGKVASIREDISFAEDFEKEIFVDYSDFGLEKVQEVSIVPVLFLEESEIFGSEINIVISNLGEIKLENPSFYCGDGTCSDDETSENCPTDCPTTNACGDGTCSSDETSENCPTDCPAPVVCGDEDAVCSEGSTEVCEVGDGYDGTNLCSADCSSWGTCIPTEFCGDGVINGNEVCETNILNGETCESQAGYLYGELTCGTNCLSYDVNDCSNSHPIFGDPLVEDNDPLSVGPFLRTWPFDDASELELPEGTGCSEGSSSGSQTLQNRQCVDPYHVLPWGLIGNADGLGDLPTISEFSSGRFVANLSMFNRAGPHSRIVVSLSKPNPDVFYIGYDMFIDSDSFYPPFPNPNIFSLRWDDDLGGFGGPSNQESKIEHISYDDIDNPNYDAQVPTDEWVRLLITRNVPEGIFNISYNGVEAYRNESASPGQNSHQFQLRTRTNFEIGTIYYDNLAVGTDYDEVLNYQG